MELIGTWDEAEARLVKEAKRDFPNFTYDNASNGGILNAMDKFFQTLKSVENSSSSVIGNIKKVKELYESFDEVLSTIDSLCSTLTNNVGVFKNCNENLLRCMETTVKSAMEKDASYGEELEVLNQLMKEEGISPTSDTPSTPSTSTPDQTSVSSTYTVSSGDTLSKIAKANGTTVAAIAAANGIKDINKLSVGQELIIPGANGSTTSSAETTPDVETQIQASEDVNGFRMDAPTQGNIDVSKYHDNADNGFVVTTGNKTYENMSSKDREVLTAIICAESDGSYDDALAVASVILNRTESPAWAWCGNSPLKQATASGQFVVYENNRYQKYMGSGVNPTVQEAVNDALNGVRNNNYYSFRSNSSTSYSSNMITSSGNRYK